MGWEDRNGHLHYYRKKRVGGQVKSIHVGGVSGLAGLPVGLVGQIIDEEERQERQQQRETERELMANDSAMAAELDEACDVVDTLVKASLMTAGYHQHKGQWRKRRTNVKRG